MKNPRFLISLWTCPHSKNITKLNEYCKAFQSSTLIVCSQIKQEFPEFCNVLKEYASKVPNNKTIIFYEAEELEKDNKERKFVCRKVADTALECTEEVVAPRLLEDHRGKLQKTPPLSL
ncbi:unnamed protein product [Lepeophtheirus salmonis]|uniref:(salmon louse) hypothetical protein n=1 Tax=Lepeophtheirus salmonis TaxID=72036 RepID=A0A7R8CZY1_LEPSM|nr:unnamed protein product [Lepeophtheirus salmonis]CAF2954547.1 unnamed protein product [Lepeophtheirus salmonis]